MSANNNDDVTLPDDGQNDLSPMIEAEPQPSASGSNYKASISFLPNETNKTFKFKSVAEASRKFETDSKSLQENLEKPLQSGGKEIDKTEMINTEMKTCQTLSCSPDLLKTSKI